MGKTSVVAQCSFKAILLLFLLSAPTACLYTVEETATQDLTLVEDSIQTGLDDSPVSSTDEFLDTIAELEKIGYQKQAQACSFPLDSGFCCAIPPAENSINKWIKITNEDFREQPEGASRLIGLEKEIKPLNLQDLLEIKQCFVRADYEVQEKMYPRATIEEWTFASAASASKVVRQLKRLSEDEWYHIHKTPISWWRKSNRIYFIYPGGNFVLTEVPKLKQIIQKNI